MNVQKADQVTNDIHSIKQEHLANLGSSQSFHLESIDQQIHDMEPYLSEILEFTGGAPHKPDSLANLGSSRLPPSRSLTTLAREFEDRFSHLVRRTDEDEDSQLSPFQRMNKLAREMEDQFSKKVFQFTNDGHLDKPECLSNCGSSLFPFEGLDHITSELEDSISSTDNPLQKPALLIDA